MRNSTKAKLGQVMFILAMRLMKKNTQKCSVTVLLKPSSQI